MKWGDIGKTQAAFERIQLSTEAPFDRFLHGDEKAVNASRRRDGPSDRFAELRAAELDRPRTTYLYRRACTMSSLRVTGTAAGRA